MCVLAGWLAGWERARQPSQPSISGGRVSELAPALVSLVAALVGRPGRLRSGCQQAGRPTCNCHQHQPPTGGPSGRVISRVGWASLVTCKQRALRPDWRHADLCKTLARRWGIQIINKDYNSCPPHRGWPPEIRNKYERLNRARRQSRPKHRSCWSGVKWSRERERERL